MSSFVVFLECFLLLFQCFSFGEESTVDVTCFNKQQADIRKHLRNVSATLTYLEDISQSLRGLRLSLEKEATPSSGSGINAHDCADLYQAGERQSGLYSVKPFGCEAGFQVYCDMKTDGGGWTMIQRRGDYYGIPEDYFLRPWVEYKNGFGDLKKEFWLGNDRIFYLSSQSAYQLRVDMWDADGTTAYARYDRFWISNETDYYRLHVGGFSGNAGDALHVHHNMNFTTRDRDHDAWLNGNCAEDRKGAWWYISCHHANLNGLNLKGPYERAGNEGIEWYDWKGSKYSLSFTEMKIRPRDYHRIIQC